MRARARSRRSATAVTALAPGDRVVLGWKTACGVCAMCERGEPRQCKRPPAARGRLFRDDGSELTPVLRTGTFATHTVVPEVAAVKIPAEPPGRAGVPDRLRGRDRRHVGARDGQGLGRCARRGDRLRRRRPLGDPGRADRRRLADPRDRPRRAQARAGEAVRRHRRRRRPGRFRVRRRRPARDVRARAVAARLGRDADADRPLARQARRRTSTCPACSRSGRASSSRTAAITCPPRTSRGSRSGRSTARSISRAWSRVWRRSAAGGRRWTACARGEAGVRTVLKPE